MNMSSLNSQEVREKFSEALKQALGADYLSINASANKPGYEVGIAFQSYIDPFVQRPDKEIIESIEKRLQKTPAFTRLVTDLEASLLAANEKVKQLESKVEELQPYKTFYDLYKDIKK